MKRMKQYDNESITALFFASIETMKENKMPIMYKLKIYCWIVV